jgi:hypothetical protein
MRRSHSHSLLGSVLRFEGIVLCSLRGRRRTACAAGNSGEAAKYQCNGSQVEPRRRSAMIHKPSKLMVENRSPMICSMAFDGMTLIIQDRAIVLSSRRPTSNGILQSFLPSFRSSETQRRYHKFRRAYRLIPKVISIKPNQGIMRRKDSPPCSRG